MNLSYQEVREVAQKNYNRGGDYIIEYWCRKDYEDYCKLHGPITKDVLEKMFASRRAHLLAWNALR